MTDDHHLTSAQARGVRYARELEGHLGWLDTFSGTALGVLATASGIYTYLGVSSLLDEIGAMSVLAAIAYSVAVSVGIFVFWSYMLRLFPAVRSARVRQSFEDLSEQEAAGTLSGLAGRGAVFRVLRQKAAELSGLEGQISAQTPLVDQAFAEGNAILSRMRALTVEPGPVEARSVEFSEQAVRLAGLITQMRQLSVAPLVERAAQDLAASVVLPELDGSTAENRVDQAATISSVLTVLAQRATTLERAAQNVIALQPAADVTYTPISSADAVILYARNFVPSWAGAIAIDLLPAVLVFILAITQSAIRGGREGAAVEDTMTLAELRAAMNAIRDVEVAMNEMPDATKPATPKIKAAE